MNKVYITFHVLTAFVDKADTKHIEAVAYFRYFAQNQYRLYTNSITIEKTYEKIYHDITPSLARNFIKSMLFSNINILSSEANDIRRAMKVLNTSRLQDFPLEQAIIAVLAEKKGISFICSFEKFHTLFGQKIFTLPV